MNYYQNAIVIWSWWKLAVMKASDGTGALWFVIRLLDGEPPAKES
jgi:hypothetical protein